MTKTDHFRMLAAALAVALAASLMMLVKPAEATFPGTNGRIVYQGQDGSEFGDYEIFSVNDAAGGTPTNVTDNVRNDFEAAFSPTGDEIAYSSSEDGLGNDKELYVVPAAGGTPTQLTSNTALDLARDPAFSPDGARVAYLGVDNTDDDWEVFVTEPEGSGTPTQLTDNTTDDHDPDWGRLPGSSSDTTAPTVGSVNPPDLKKNVSPRTNVTATFSEAMQTSTVGTATFTLVRKGTTTPVGATVSYDPATTKATLDPNSRLKAGMTYIARVRGGNSGMKDLAANALAADKVWRFAIRN